MPPFSLSLKTKRVKGGRPRSPTSPASFYSPQPAWPPSESLDPSISQTYEPEFTLLTFPNAKPAHSAATDSTGIAHSQPVTQTRPPSRSDHSNASVASNTALTTFLPDFDDDENNGVQPPNRRPQQTRSRNASVSTAPSSFSGPHSAAYIPGRRAPPPPPIRIPTLPKVVKGVNRTLSRKLSFTRRTEPDEDNVTKAVKATKAVPGILPSVQDKGNPSVAEIGDLEQTPLVGPKRTKELTLELDGITRERSLPDSNTVAESRSRGSTLHFGSLRGDSGHPFAQETHTHPVIKRVSSSPVISATLSRDQSSPTPLASNAIRASPSPSSSPKNSEKALRRRPDHLAPISSHHDAETSGVPHTAVVFESMNTPSLNGHSSQDPHYIPQAGDLMFSPAFIMQPGELTPSLFPESYSMVVPRRSEDSAKASSNDMYGQDSATLPPEDFGMVESPITIAVERRVTEAVESSIHSRASDSEALPKFSSAPVRTPSTRVRSRTIQGSDTPHRNDSSPVPSVPSPSNNNLILPPTHNGSEGSNGRRSPAFQMRSLRRSISAAVLGNSGNAHNGNIGSVGIIRSDSQTSSRSGTGSTKSGIGAGGLPTIAGVVVPRDRLLDSAKRFLRTGSVWVKPISEDNISAPSGGAETLDIVDIGHSSLSVQVPKPELIRSTSASEGLGLSRPPPADRSMSSPSQFASRHGASDSLEALESRSSREAESSSPLSMHYLSTSSSSRTSPRYHSHHTSPSTAQTSSHEMSDQKLPSTQLIDGPPIRVRSASESSPASINLPTIAPSPLSQAYSAASQSPSSSSPSPGADTGRMRSFTSPALFAESIPPPNPNPEPETPAVPKPHSVRSSASRLRRKRSHKASIEALNIQAPMPSTTTPASAPSGRNVPSALTLMPRPHQRLQRESSFPQTPRMDSPISSQHHSPPPSRVTRAESTSAVSQAKPSKRGTSRPSLPVGLKPEVTATAKRPRISESRSQPSMSLAARSTTPQSFLNANHRERATSDTPPKQSEDASSGNKQPPTPTFDSIPIRWKGLTMDHAKWTFTSEQLQAIVGRAIRQSAEVSSVRILVPEVLDVELPEEIERLELERDEIKAKYKHQVRLRRLLMRSLQLYIDGSDVVTARRLSAELSETSTTCDLLSEELFVVTDQLAQLGRLRDCHSSSALTMALQKLNGSFLRSSSEIAELRARLASAEAERDEGWAKAFEVEAEVDELRSRMDDSGSSQPDDARSVRSHRVSAARQNSVRASKAALRPSSSRRSARSSTTSSMKYASIIFPHPPTFGDPREGLAPPPVPHIPESPAYQSIISHGNPRPDSILSRFTPGLLSTPNSTSRTMFHVQNEVLEMLGVSVVDFNRTSHRRTRSHSSAQTVSPSNITFPPPSIPFGRRARANSEPGLDPSRASVGLFPDPDTLLFAFLSTPAS